MAVILETSLGDLTLDLYTEERPTCCLNFLKLCKIKYYNFCLFHSVQRDLVAQTGDPTGSGKSGESIYGKLFGEQGKYFDAETKPRIKHKKPGTLSMVNNGDNMHGSQFFITLASDIDYLDGKHTVFGEVSEGLEVVQKINEAFTDKEHRPYKDIRIFHTVVIDDPFDDPGGLADLIPGMSPVPTKEQLESGRIGVDENIDDFEGKSQEEIEEIFAEKEAKARTQILEMVGDLPEADMTPPDNVLFVCKLNPVTTEEDLEVIFSRFGNINSCEVIKDHKSGESLQYAFIEFENHEDCESAYFKMDNVLIDDRRVHVDFSQSVAKLKWKGKGKGVENQNDKDEEKPKYKIKDTSRKDSKYDLVFEEKTSPDRSKKHKHKKDKKKLKKSKKYSDSDTASPEQQTSLKTRQSEDRPDHKYRRKDLDEGRHSDSSRERNKDRDRENRCKERNKDKESRNRDRSKDRDRSRDGERDRGKEMDRKNRDRSREKDRDRDGYHRERRDKRKRDRSKDRDWH